MPQIMIDTAAETPESLRRIAAMLVFLAAQSDPVPAGTVVVVAAPVVPSRPAVSLEGALPIQEQRDPAQVFGGASNVVALRPVAPEVPAAPNPSVPAAPSPIVGDAATPAVPTAPADVVLDGAGLPHDARIHSQPPTTNANGLWRIRRSTAKNPCPPELIQEVEAELRAIYPAKVVTPTVPLPPNVPVVPVAPTAPTAPVTLPGVPTPGSAVQAPVAPGVPSGNDAFRLMMDKFSKEMGVNGRLNKTVMGPIFASLGVAGWQEFFKKPELIPQVTAAAEGLLT